MHRYLELRKLNQRGLIKDLEMQKRYPLVVRNILVGHYVADFVYMKKGGTIKTVEDVKGVLTPMYRFKKKIFEALYNTQILET